MDAEFRAGAGGDGRGGRFHGEEEGVLADHPRCGVERSGTGVADGDAAIAGLALPGGKGNLLQRWLEWFG